MLIATAAINGAGAGILWVSQGKFISECATDQNKGFFNSYFWGFFMSSQITGNTIAAILLGRGGSQTILFIIFAFLATGGSLLFCCLKMPKKQSKLKVMPNNKEGGYYE